MANRTYVMLINGVKVLIASKNLINVLTFVITERSRLSKSETSLSSSYRSQLIFYFEVKVFNATFNNISVIVYRGGKVLLVEEKG